MPNGQHPYESDPVLSVEGINLPEDVAEWVLEEPSNVLESSPFLGHISGLSCCVHELAIIAIGFLGKCSLVRLSS